MESIAIPDIDRLRTLAAVVTHGGFRMAADELYMAASTVQKQMRALEREVGITLFERDGRNVRIMPAAHELARLSHRAIAAHTDLNAAIERLRRRSNDTVRIAAAPVHMASRLGVSVRQFRQTRSSEVEVTLCSSDFFRDKAALSALLYNGSVDVLFTTSELPDLDRKPLWPITLVTVLPPEHRKSRARSLRIDHLAGMTVFAQESYMWSRRELVRITNEAGIDIEVITEPLPDVCVALADAGMGAAVLADDDLAARQQKRVRLLNATGKPVASHVYCYWLPDQLSRPVAEFVDFL